MQILAGHDGKFIVQSGRTAGLVQVPQNVFMDVLIFELLCSCTAEVDLKVVYLSKECVPKL
jgi:hypothetical protein